MSLAHIFRERARVPPALPDDGDLEGLLASRFEAARAAWPDVDLPAEQFVRHVAERLPASGEGKPVAKVLDALALSDLYLACACANRVPGAGEALEREHLAKLPLLLKRQFPREAAAGLEDVVQEVRAKLLLGSPGGGPHLLTFTGEGGLHSWITVIATRAVSKQLEPREGPSAPDPDDIFSDLPSTGDLGDKLLKEELRQKLRAAMRDAVASVTSKDQRYLLKLHYAERVSTVKLAKLFGTSQPGMWRQLERIRESILSETKRLLRERHGIGGDELKELVTTLQSRMDMTLSKIFGSGDQLPGGPESRG